MNIHRGAVVCACGQAADALGVSRQTVSNRENGKTYPDIISVIKMSDLYSISLDLLLKGENEMPDYLEYPEESTNTVKAKKRLSKLLVIIAYLVIWAFSLIMFYCFTDGGDALDYGIIFHIILLPTTTLVLSFIIGLNNYWGKLKWVSAPIFGFMYMLAEYATFSVANMIANIQHGMPRFNMPQFSWIFYGAVISAVGISIGLGVRCLSMYIMKRLRRRRDAAADAE